MSHAPRFSMSEFQKWFSKQDDVKNFFEIQEENANPLAKFVGHEARPKVSKNKLLEKIEEASGDEYELIHEFCEDGGSISDVNGKNLCIETEGGHFELPRFCVKVLRG